MSPQKKAENIFERAKEAAPNTLYGDYNTTSDLDERYVIFEYEGLGEGIGVIPSDEIEMILEGGAANGEEFPLFRGIEASEGYIRKALEDGEELMAARIRNGEVADTGYMIEEGELKGLMALKSTD
ncbi:hypothetical protein [Candidatus Nanohalovita haloferacivicina]|uniref:hypothetical protein n=1 Tax=Candidatus Nanohalovita haloferacivicina TaxID=2978046 RepID=UPI00325FC7A0|nr:hypothetical protein HBNXNv_0660 [Candidatus Nanohalobia archaeon BNXNv]